MSFFCDLLKFVSIMVLLTSLSGYQGSVSVCKGSEETVLEVSHQVHDVVPEARGAQDHHRWVWTGVGSSPHTDLWSLWCWLRFLFLSLCCSLRALTFTLTTRNGARERRRGSPSSTGTWKTETCSDGRTDGRTQKDRKDKMCCCWHSETELQTVDRDCDV